MSQPRVAIFFVGRITGWHHVRKTLKTFQETYNATFFVSLNAELFSESDILFFKYFGLGPDQIRAEFSPVPEKFKIFKNMYSQYYQNDKCFSMIEAYCTKYNTFFDVVVKSRADLDTPESLKIQWPVQENRIYCPTHDAYQVKDEINYGEFRTMKLYSLLIDTLEDSYNNGSLWYGSSRHPMLPELVLFQYISQLNQVFGTNIIYIDYKFKLHDGRFDIDALTKKTSKVAILFPGRVKSWQYNRKSLLELKIQYNATFFCSVNMSVLDEDTKEFCRFFDIQEDQIIAEETCSPNKYTDFYYTFYSQQFHLEKSFNLLEKYQEKYGMQFDTVVRYRSDISTDELLDLNNIQANTLYLTQSAFGGFNDMVYYGDFNCMKRICNVFSRFYDFLEDNNLFTVDFLNLFKIQRNLSYGNTLSLEERFFLMVNYAAIETQMKIIFFNFYYVLHPHRKTSYWNHSIEDKFQTLYSIAKKITTKKENLLESFNTAQASLIQEIEKNDDSMQNIAMIKGFAWPTC